MNRTIALDLDEKDYGAVRRAFARLLFPYNYRRLTMAMPTPKARCRRRPGKLTIEIDSGSWPCERDFFLLMADALDEKATRLNLHQSDMADAVYLRSMAAVIAAAVSRADQEEQGEITNIFG